MPKSTFIELAEEVRIPILYEDRSVLAVDKPVGWLVAPSTWERTARNLQRAIDSSVNGREFWAASRNLRFLKFVHRLDAETSGVLLFVKSPGAMGAYSDLFQSRVAGKQYLAVVEGKPSLREWTCELPISEDPAGRGRMRIDKRQGKPACTHFRVLESSEGTALILVEPITGRTHQIRLHLASDKLPILGDPFYGSKSSGPGEFPMALRAIGLAYTDPFTKKPVAIRAPAGDFVRAFGFNPGLVPNTPASPRPGRGPTSALTRS